MIFWEFQRIPTKSSEDLLYAVVAMFGDGARKFVVRILHAQECYA